MTRHVDVNNSNFGDLVQGDKYQNAAKSPLEKALELVKKAAESDTDLKGYIEDLSEYLSPRAGRKVIGLENKLADAGLSDLYDDAVYLKNKFERRLARKQLSEVEQVIYCHVLANIISVFNHKVKPLMGDGIDRAELDAALYDEIVSPVYAAISQHDLYITAEHVRGMIYFLTGKCHLVWSS